MNRNSRIAERALARLTRVIYESLKPPSGCYAIFSHLAHTSERLRDCNRIIRRLYKARKHLTKRAYLINSLYPDGRPPVRPLREPLPPRVRNLEKRESEQINCMKMDFESLYIFSGMLLDQWALSALYISGMKNPEDNFQHPFHNLVDELDKERASRYYVNLRKINLLWKELKSELLWLDFQIRFYRNRLVVHVDRPWQRGKNMSLYGDEFRLSSMTPPGWLDNEKYYDEIKSLVHLAPDRIKDAPDDYWEKARPKALLERLFFNIGNIESREDRKKVSWLYNKIGGMTPSFQAIAERLLCFINRATAKLCEIAKENVKEINLGRSKENYDENLK